MGGGQQCQSNTGQEYVLYVSWIGCWMKCAQRCREPVEKHYELQISINTAVIAVVVLVLLLLLGVILRYMYKHKGTYHTNEAKGTEFSETADSALRRDPALQDAMDESKKEYFI
ncbi:glycophorin-C [Pimephales promelas]|nr:glycophorin-C [Pimephales promelas]